MASMEINIVPVNSGCMVISASRCRSISLILRPIVNVNKFVLRIIFNPKEMEERVIYLPHKFI
jgi:hypothetical protein